MKKLGWLNKAVFVLNTVFALLLLLAYALPYVFPKQFPLLSVLSLSLPFFLLINIAFMLFWALQLKRQLLLSFIILLLGYKHVHSLYKFGGNSEPEEVGFSAMSFNVRLFNVYEWIKDDSVPQKIVRLVSDENPDVLCLQDFHRNHEDSFPMYKYSYFYYNKAKGNSGIAIFSKYKIINKGSLNFPSKGNNGIYVDILKDYDTVRVYNLHLESHRIVPEKEELTKENSERLFKRMANTFTLQQTQAEIFDKHRKLSKHKTIVCGDFNNTAYSRIFKQIKGDMNDTFEEKGKGFGATFNFRYFPMRIDFILADKELQVLSHKNFREKLSDHYPLKAVFKL